MKVLLINNNRIENTVKMAEKIASALAARNIDVQIDDSRSDKAIDGISLIVVLGGDGTFIRTARKYFISDIPILGVNMGTIGFLSNIEADEVELYMDKLIKQDYTVDERMMLEVNISRNGETPECFYALNELSIKSAISGLIKLDMEIGGQKQFAYRGDGIIIATPTGSTAYSLSCGGPITDPDLEAFIVTPIAPYLFSKKPMVIAASKDICLFPLKGNEITIYIDGQAKSKLGENHLIKINKAERKLKMVNLKGSTFFQTIGSRLQRREG